jgi:hypothetical protein
VTFTHSRIQTPAAPGFEFRLRAGDSLLAPRNVAHVWACVGEKLGKMIVVFQPAGKMEEFFRALGTLKGAPSQEEVRRLFLDHGMTIVCPPARDRLSIVALEMGRRSS